MPSGPRTFQAIHDQLRALNGQGSDFISHSLTNDVGAATCIRNGRGSCRLSLRRAWPLLVHAHLTRLPIEVAVRRPETDDDNGHSVGQVVPSTRYSCEDLEPIPLATATKCVASTFKQCADHLPCGRAIHGPGLFGPSVSSVREHRHN